MRRGLAKLAPPPSTISAAAFSTFSGGGGFGRGRGSGASPSPPSSVPGEPSSQDPDEDPFLSAAGRGRGRGGVDGPQQSSPLFPSFPSFVTSSQGQGQGRGRGAGAPSPGSTSDNPETASKKPVFFSRYDQVPPKPADDNSLPPKPDYSSFVSALERGKPSTKPGKTESSRKQADAKRPIRSREEATRRALEVLSRGGQARGGTGRDERGIQDRGWDRGYGRDTEEVQEDEMAAESEPELDDAEVEKVREKIMQTLGKEKANVLEEALRAASSLAVPSKLEHRIKDALETNYKAIIFSPFCFICPNLFV